MYAPPGMARGDDDSRIPGGRVQRTAKVGSVIGTQGARYAGTRAANVVRSKDRASQALDDRHMEAAERMVDRSEEHTSELQSRQYLVCRLLLEKKKQNI